MDWGETGQGALETECCVMDPRLNTKQAGPLVIQSSSLSLKAAHTLRQGGGSGGQGGSVCGHSPVPRLAGMPELGKGAGQ